MGTTASVFVSIGRCSRSTAEHRAHPSHPISRNASLYDRGSVVCRDLNVAIVRLMFVTLQGTDSAVRHEVLTASRAGGCENKPQPPVETYGTRGMARPGPEKVKMPCSTPEVCNAEAYRRASQRGLERAVRYNGAGKRCGPVNKVPVCACVY